MESLKFAMGSALSKVFGGTAETDENSVHDTVQRVISRLEISTLLEDRRNACKTLRALSSNYRSEVGSLGMDVLIQTLKNDKEDREIVGDILTTLNCIIAGDSNDESDEQTSDDPLDIPFTQMFIKKKENIELIFDIIRDKDYLDCRFRPQALKLFNAISRNRPKDIQDFILSKPMGVSTLVDLLSDFRDFIRLDAISLLTRLAKNNASIQKIAAYENAFDKLILLIEAEEFAAGGVIVKDCLVLLQNLLKNNDCTQNLFKEGNHIQKLGPLLSIIFNNDWPDEKVVQIKTNVHLTLQIIRMLVSPTNPQQVTTLCQNAIKSSGILLKLCDIIFYEGSPADIVTEVFNTIAEIIRGNHTNQAFFRKISDENSSAPILLRLLESMINSKNPLDLRCAALYCFQSFLCQNDVGQAHIIDGLLGSQVLDATMCELLCGSLLSSKLLSNWFASTALSHAIIGNQTQKQQLLSVHLAIKDQDSPISLLRLCCSRVQDGVKYQSRVGLLMLLSHWLSECPSAVSEFLQIVTNIPFLISEVSSRGGDESELVIQGLYAFLIGLCIQYNDGSVQSYSRENLLELIIRRVGVEIFSKKLSAIAQSEWYSVAASKPQIKINDENQLMFDYEFCKLFRSLESSIIKIVQNEPSIMSNGPECSMSAEQHTLLLQYKELIRRQDEDISSLKAQLEIAQKERNKATEKIDELSSKYQQVLDQNALLRVQSSVYSPSHPSSLILGSTINNNDETSSQVSSSDMPARFVGSNIETMSMPDGSETKIPIMNEHEEERASMLEKMQSLEMQLSRAQIEANMALSERDNAQMRLSESEVVISQLESRVSEQNSVIQALTARNDELENAYSNISHQLYAAQQKIQHLEAYYGQALHSMNNQTTLNQEGLNSQAKQSGYQNESTPRYSNSDSTFSSDPGTHSSSQQENSSIPPSGMNHNSAGFLEL